MTENPKYPPIPWVKSPDGVLEVYANMMHITWSLDDLRVRLGQIINSAETPNPGQDFKSVAEERAAVTFTWRAAKILRDQLNIVIDAYEKTNGEIRVNLVLPDANPKT